MLTKFKPIADEPQQIAQTPVGLWDRFERSVHDHPEAWLVGLVVAAACLSSVVGN